MMILTEDGIICARDSWGRTPIIIGKKEGAYAASSETTSFPNLDYETAYEVGPGEIVKIKADGMEQIRPANKKMQVCSFLWVYYGFPTSTYEGKNVEEARFTNGFNLAKTDDVEVDCCSGIPDSGTGMAMGYAAGKGVPYQRCIAKYTPTWPRSFTPSNQSMRSLVAKMKLIPNKAMLKGKRVLFCDDSIVRGTQLRDNVKVLFDQAGLKECHMRIACPPLVYGCPFINFTSSKSDGYFLPTILTTLGLIFYDAWQLSAVTEEEGRAKFFTQIFRTYSSVLFCCAAGIIWLCRPVMHVMKSNYYYAWHFVPFLVLASTCSCFNQFMNSVYVVNKKSQRSMVTMMAGAISNCLMNYFFIKWWGPVGATYASFLGLGLVFTLRAMDAHGMIGMRVHPGRVLVNAAALVFEAFVLLADTPLYGLWTGIITALIILYNFSGVWAMARILLPKILGRRGKALVAVVDGILAQK